MSDSARYLLMLEDEASRVARFEKTLPRIAPDLQLRVWCSAHQMMAESEALFAQTAAISLDHDLYVDDGPDPGDGLDVANFLAGHPPFCPIIIHSSNSQRAMFMMGALEGEGWTVHRSVPLGDDWIEEDWAIVLEEALTGQRSRYQGEWTDRHRSLVQDQIDAAPLHEDARLRKIAQDLNGLVLGAESQLIWLLTADGTVATLKPDGVALIQTREDFMSRMTAITIGETRYPRLAKLRPPRPIGAPDCVCRAQTRAGFVCSDCGGLGWVFSDSATR